MDKDTKKLVDRAEELTKKNQAYLKEIIRIKIDDKKYDVAVMEVKFFHDYYCFYTYLEFSQEMKDEQLESPTFRQGATIGIDTTHSYNIEQSMEQKYDDGLKQITSCIKCYESNVKKLKGNLKHEVRKRVVK